MRLIRYYIQILTWDLKAVEAERCPGDPPILGGSSDKARRILNWQPAYPRLDDIIKTVWLRQSAGIGKEVDFLIRRGRDITAALQLCQDIGANETRKRELSLLSPGGFWGHDPNWIPNSGLCPDPIPSGVVDCHPHRPRRLYHCRLCPATGQDLCDCNPDRTGTGCL